MILPLFRNAVFGGTLLVFILCACATPSGQPDAEIRLHRSICQTDPARETDSIRTMRLRQTVELTGQKVYGTIITEQKLPGQARIETDIPGIDQVIITIDSQTITETRRLTGIRSILPGSPEHEQIRFDLFFSMPRIPLDELFESYADAPYPDPNLDAVTAIPRKDSWPQIHPVTFLIDKRNGLLREIRMRSYTNGGCYQTRTVFRRYRPLAASSRMLIPDLIDQNFDENENRAQTNSFELNIPLDDNRFKPVPDDFQ